LGEKLSKRNIVLVRIRTIEKAQKGKGVGFNELVKQLKGNVSRATISKALDSLFDMGILDSEWILKDGKWKKEITVANEARDMVDEMIKDLKKKKLIK
jgi:DNA-binding transcriptional ArsR family regulator